MKKIILFFLLTALSIWSFSCGGGAGSSNSPSGENHGVPSIVQLQPSHFVAQTNTNITLHAKVLDGNGAPVSGEQVIFTDLSPIGVLSATTARTNQSGIATVTIKSTTDGFSTVQAEASNGVAQIRDRKTVFFSSISVRQPVPVLTLTVSGNGDPFVLFEPGVANDDEVTATATVFDGFGRRIAGIDVLFGSDSSEATFPLGSLVSTDTNGQASVLVKVVPSTLRSLPTIINITALAANGAFNMVSLFLNPVSVGTITVFANPQSIESGGTSTITANVTTTAGTPAPDGTTVNFTVSPSSAGGIEPFAQTTGGIAEVQFTAAEVTVNTIAAIKASVGTVFDTVNVTITAPPVEPTVLVVVPGSVSAIAGVGGKFNFTISGGTPPYTTTSTNPAKACNSTDTDCSDATDTGTWTGSSVIATVPATATPGTVTLNVFDSAGGSVSSTITIACTNPPSISPTSATICENTTGCPAGTTTATFGISGGSGTYTSIISSNAAVILSPAVSNPFTVDAINDSVTSNTTVTLTVTDSAGCPATATVTVINQ